mmetsp:Transcript_17042/g.41794  ORF Transcript_17042/g.41794 Transcript_17042/m.41794 type:complete len:168 (-) Transcript_17042:73-576(-)
MGLEDAVQLGGALASVFFFLIGLLLPFRSWSQPACFVLEVPQTVLFWFVGFVCFQGETRASPEFYDRIKESIGLAYFGRGRAWVYTLVGLHAVQLRYCSLPKPGWWHHEWVGVLWYGFCVEVVVTGVLGLYLHRRTPRGPRSLDTPLEEGVTAGGSMSGGYFQTPAS